MHNTIIVDAHTNYRWGWLHRTLPSLSYSHSRLDINLVILNTKKVGLMSAEKKAGRKIVFNTFLDHLCKLFLVFVLYGQISLKLDQVGTPPSIANIPSNSVLIEPPLPNQSFLGLRGNLKHVMRAKKALGKKIIDSL